MIDNRREGKGLRLNSNTNYALHRLRKSGHSQLAVQFLGGTGVGRAPFPR